MRIFKLIAAGLVLTLLAFGCSNDDNGTGPGTPEGTNSTTWDGVGQFWVTTLDATSYDSYTYYSFDEKDVVVMTDATAEISMGWDIAFKRSFIKSNGGVSGPAGAKSADLVDLGIVEANKFTDVTSAHAEQVAEEEWMEDSYDFALDSLWNYNFQTHQVSAKQFVYVLTDAEGYYVKFQLLGTYDGLQPPQQGKMILKYFYQPTMDETSLVGAAEIDTVDAPDGFYYDFSSGQVVAPANPENSMDWDIHVESYDIFLNSSVSGSGQAAAFAAYDGLADKTDFDAVTDVNQFGQIRWVQDQLASAFTTKDWFNYNSQTHVLTSKRHTYLVSAEGKTYKVEIVSFYGESTADDAIYTIHWAEL